MKKSEQLIQIKDNLKAKCPLAVDEIVASFARCEIIHDICNDKVEKYFAGESMNVLHDLSTQLLTLAEHPNIQQIVENIPDEL